MTEGGPLSALALRSVLAAGRRDGRGGRALHAVLSGIWLGLLDDAALAGLDERLYERDAMYRTVEWNTRGLWEWERAAVTRWIVPGGRVAVPACGGGREVLALLRAGYDAVGYEPHPSLAAYAQSLLAERGHPNRVHRAPRDRFPGAGRCDGVLVGWGALSLIAPRARRIAFLRAAGGAVAPAGAVIASAFIAPGHGVAQQVTARLAGAGRRARALPPVELGDTLAPNRVHVFTRAELEAELRAAGLAPVSLGAVGRSGPRVEYACAVGRPA